MRMPNWLTASRRGTRLAVLGAAALLLAGCATGYSFVQPDMAGSGSYYTSAGPYAGQGYYDYDSPGSYYPGAADWGYYGWPYSNPWYGGYGYGPFPFFGLGFSNGWGYPGYWGPWYATRYQRWHCMGPGCASWGHHHHRHDGHHHGGSDAPRPWVKLPRMARNNGFAPPVSVPSRPMVRHPGLEPSISVPDEFVRAPIRRSVETNFNRMPMRPAYLPPVPQESALANRRELPVPMTAPREMFPVARPVFRSQPAPIAPVVAPPPRNTHVPGTKIQ